MSIQIRLGQGQPVSVCSQESVQRRRGMAAVEGKSYQGHEKANGNTWAASGVIRIDQGMKGLHLSAFSHPGQGRNGNRIPLQRFSQRRRRV